MLKPSTDSKSLSSKLGRDRIAVAYRNRSIADKSPANAKSYAKPSLWRIHEQFAVDCDPTMGVELEFFLVDKDTGQPTAIYDQVYQRLPAEIQCHTVNEFLKCQIEYATPICRDADECGSHLQRFIDAATDAAARENASLLWKATLPNWKFDSDMIYDCDRSRENIRRLGSRAHLLSTCGMHVHVAVPRAAAIQVVDQMQVLIPGVVRMSANSPQMHGRAESMASHRAKIWGSEFPMLTYPHYFGDWQRFYNQIARLRRFGTLRQPKDLYMLARPTVHGTAEVRAADLPKDLDTVVEIAAKVQSSVIEFQHSPAKLPPLKSLWLEFQRAYTGIDEC